MSEKPIIFSGECPEGHHPTLMKTPTELRALIADRNASVMCHKCGEPYSLRAEAKEGFMRLLEEHQVSE